MRTAQISIVAAVTGALISPSASAQSVVYSIAWQGPTISVPDSLGGVPITEGDLLAAPPTGIPTLGPLAAPIIARSHLAGGLGLMTGCVGHPGGTPCFVEVDAVSQGLDPLLTPNGIAPGLLAWSTDEYATSFFGIPMAPNLFSEAPSGDSSADLWTNLLPIFGLPLPPFAVPADHRGLLDGDGLPSGTGFAYPGLGLKEPNIPAFGTTDLGDDVDAVTFDHIASVRAFFSLDAGFIDPLTGLPNSGSAAAHAFSAADVLVTPAAFGPPVVFAPAPTLGLGLTGIPDDLDALYLWENGSGVFEPSLVPFDWLAGGTDLLLFSVRRGSAVIGAPDSIFGIPISEGDILTTPMPTALGGVSPFPGHLHRRREHRPRNPTLRHGHG